MNNLIIFFLLTFSGVLYSQECLGGELRTLDSYLYGRFEVNMKSVQGDGYVSSFFTYHDFWGQEYDDWESLINEIDIEFTGNLENSVQFTTHHPGPWSLSQILDVDFNPFEGFNDYAFEWTPNEIRWFVNGIEIYSQDQNVVQDLIYPQKIMMNLWAAIWEDWVGPWDPTTMPVNSYYNFVKYYNYTPGNGNYGTDDNFTLLWEEPFESFDNTRWVEATHGFNGNNCQFDPVNVVIHNDQLVLFVSDTQYVLGDINHDTILDILDVVQTINIILLFEEVTNVADYNQDNVINILDIILIVDSILN